MSKIIIPLSVVILMLSACASNIPIEIRQDANDISIDSVHSDFDLYKGQRIRWGGTITNVENNASDSWIEIVAKDLNSYGRPRITDHSLGRFIVRIDGFIDPAIYKTDRELTVYGVVESRVVRQIDEHSYTYPLIKAEKYYLWRDYYHGYYARSYYYPYYYPYRYHYPFNYYYPYHFGFRFGHHFGHHHRYR